MLMPRAEKLKVGMERKPCLFFLPLKVVLLFFVSSHNVVQNNEGSEVLSSLEVNKFSTPRLHRFYQKS